MNIFDFASHVPIVQNASSVKRKENVSDADIVMKNAAN